MRLSVAELVGGMERAARPELAGAEVQGARAAVGAARECLNPPAAPQARRYIQRWAEASKDGPFSAYEGMKAFTFNVLVNQVGAMSKAPGQGR